MNECIVIYVTVILVIGCHPGPKKIGNVLENVDLCKGSKD